MAHIVWTDAFVSWDGTDLSAHVKSVTPSRSVAEVNDSMMGDDTEVLLGGVKQWSFDIAFAADEAAGATMATLWDELGTTGTLIVRPVGSSVVSATNPNYTGTALLTSFPPPGGSHGDLAMAPASFKNAGSLSRTTS